MKKIFNNTLGKIKPVLWPQENLEGWYLQQIQDTEIDVMNDTYYV